jgi:hypothetical protein
MDEEQTPSETPPEQPQEDHAPSQPQPVAYDEEGRPLYAAPPSQSYMTQPGPQFVHLSRDSSSVNPSASPEFKAKHDESVRRFPSLNISDSEYVMNDIPRHPAGMLPTVITTLFLAVIIITVMISYPLLVSRLAIMNPIPFSVIFLGGSAIVVLLFAIAYISVWVYKNNKFILTNESIIQEIQTGLFTHNEQTISLANIEDASYHQGGVMQMMFNYGSIRLSTEGEESTYEFTYVADPKSQIAILNNAVESFKNGRPVAKE